MYLDVKEIPEIQRDGINLSSTVSISYLDAILGAAVKVNLLSEHNYINTKFCVLRYLYFPSSSKS